jgi:DNA-binding LacI/PurR family transcriptional regulator
MTKKTYSVTIRDVAKQADVSIATVSRYINKNAHVSQEVAERITQAMANLDYKLHVNAQNLASRRTNNIGLLLNKMSNVFFEPLMAGISAVINERGYNLMVATRITIAESQYQLPVGPQNTDGLLIFVDNASGDHVFELSKKKFPIVLIHCTPPSGLEIPFVTVENKIATFEIIEHLIVQHGRKHILFMGGPQKQEDACLREQSYCAALASHQIPLDRGLMLVGEFESAVAYRILRDYLGKHGQNFDAVFAGDDDAAVGVLRALDEMHIRVPEAVSVVGFDDSILSAYITPSLTTVHAPTELVGRTAAEILIDIIQGKPVKRENILPTKLVIRRSCGCNPAAIST